MWDLIEDVVASDSSAQRFLDEVAGELMRTENPGERVLDLGCGAGSSIDLFRGILPSVQWTGVDIASSPEVNARTRTDGHFATFDGVHIPFPDNSFDLIFSRQVMEHVRYPERLLVETLRVLRPGGYFVGSTSHLEPYHSYSYWNFTPWGFRIIAEDAGFRMLRLYPGIDGLTLITRSVFAKYKKSFGRFWREESPLNRWLARGAARRRLSEKHTNIRKLQFCGQFIFVLAKD